MTRIFQPWLLLKMRLYFGEADLIAQAHFFAHQEVRLIAFTRSWCVMALYALVECLHHLR